MGIRTVAGFLVGFPDDTDESISRVELYARRLNPTYANFNVVTPYPGTKFYAENRDRIAEADFSRYSSYTPVLNYDNLTPEELTKLNGRSFNHFYFRWEYLRDNAHLLWPALQRFGWGRRSSAVPGSARSDNGHPAVPRPLSGLEMLNRKGLRQDTPHRPRMVSK
jgi:radical SAM superfamily enzyme YgiQ (UPF0313 family)